MALAIGEGHSNVYTYGWNFFMTVLEVISDKKEEGIRNMALAVRASRMDEKEFMAFVNIERKVDHDEIYKKHQEGNL